MKITVTKKKEIEVELSEEQVEEIVGKALSNYYYETPYPLPSNVLDALTIVYSLLTGKNLNLERPHGSS